MSVQGTILVLDGVSTNRIMLKVQLTAAWYHVVQGEKLNGLAALLRRTRPDLILTAQSLPDGTAADVKRLIAREPGLVDVPVVAIAPQNDKGARLRALGDGLDDVLTLPLKDTLLLARIRSLLRASADTQDLQASSGTQTIGFAEPAPALIAPPPKARVGILTRTARVGALWHTALKNKGFYTFSAHTQSNLTEVLSGSVPDALIVELDKGPTDLNLLADLRSRSATRHTVLIGVMQAPDGPLAAEALDRGADAVCLDGFCPREVLLRLNNQLSRKARMDQMRASLKKGVVESWIDPLTGLHNRRYAMRAMDQIVQQSLRTGRGFAVMLADLDHFKSINDSYGHASGDRVLTQAAKRMRHVLSSTGFVARIGGEEFMIGVPDISQTQALTLAKAICNSICDTPFDLPDQRAPVGVTISVGLLMSPPRFRSRDNRFEPVERLIKSADLALYAAKRAGRNQVRIRQSAA